MTETDVARYIAMVEKVVKRAEIVPGILNLNVLVVGTEELVDQLTTELEADGLVYVPQSNECRSTARAILWASWVSWLWASKAETRQPPDEQAKRTRPIAERLLSDAIELGRRIGEEGRPEDFLTKRGFTP